VPDRFWRRAGMDPIRGAGEILHAVLHAWRSSDCHSWWPRRIYRMPRGAGSRRRCEQGGLRRRRWTRTQPLHRLRRRFATEPRSGECLTGSLGASLDRIQRKSRSRNSRRAARFDSSPASLSRSTIRSSTQIWTPSTTRIISTRRRKWPVRARRVPARTRSHAGFGQSAGRSVRAWKE